MAETAPQVIAVLGCGNIGHCFGVLFAAAGYTVKMFDSQQSAREACIQRCRAKFEQLQAEDLARSSDPFEVQLARIRIVDSLAECVKDAIFVQEAVAEIIDVKIEIFKQLDELISNDNVVLASATSALLPSQFTEQLKHRSQCIVVHPVFPPVFLLATEIMPAPWTNQKTIDAAKKIISSIGQIPIMFKKETRGFAVNRLQYALVSEAYKLIHEGCLDLEDVELVMSEGLGPRWALFGVLETAAMTAHGISDMMNKFGPSVEKVVLDAGPPVNINTEPTRSIIAADMQSRVPAELVPEFHAYRDVGLAKMRRLKAEWKKQSPLEKNNSKAAPE